MHNQTKQPATITFPLTGLRPLYRAQSGNTLVLEVDINDLKQFNEPATIDEMAAEARLEYCTGRTQGVTDAKQLMDYLET